MSWISRLARPDIVALESYTCPERDPDFTRLHANELPWRSGADASAAGLNRYPDPQPAELIAALAALYGVDAARVLATRGTDEGIDLLVRTFCRAGRDAVVVCPPAFVMYAISARIQGAQVIEVPLLPAQQFALEPHCLLARCTEAVKLVFLCSPNNPTGNLMAEEAVLGIADALAGRALVVVDEAYVEFAARASLAAQLSARPQLVLLRTLSKAHGLAGARCGALLGDPEVLSLLRKIIAPFPLTQLSTEAALGALAPVELARTHAHVRAICAERARLAAALTALPRVRRVWPSDANFMLAEFADAAQALALARQAHLLVRDARRYLDQSLRITVGTAAENQALLEAWT
jgi:histidinol-phosphate aminotransferase